MQRLLRPFLRHPGIILLIIGLISLVALEYAGRLVLRSNFSDMLPEAHPAVEQAQTLNKMVGGASYVILTVETEQADAAVRFLDDVKSQTDSWSEVLYIDDRPPEKFFRKNGLFYMDLEDLQELRESIARKIDRAKLSKTGFFIELDEPGDTEELVAFEDKYAYFINAEPYYQNKAGTLFVSLIKPAWRSTDVSQTTPFFE